MRRRFPEFGERRVAPVALLARRLAGLSAMLFGLAALGHRYGLIETIPFLWILGIVVLLAVTALGTAWLGFQRLWNHGERAGRASLSAAILAALVLAPFGWAAVEAVRHPPLSDISTDLDTPPSLRRLALLRQGAMNPISEISEAQAAMQIEAYPGLVGRRHQLGLDAMRASVQGVMAAMRWRVAAESREDHDRLTIEAVAPTPLMRFPVDAAVRLVEEEGATTVDVRLNSRYGAHDLGDGARRIARFLTELERAVAEGLADGAVEEAEPEEDDATSGDGEDAVE